MKIENYKLLPVVVGGDGKKREKSGAKEKEQLNKIEIEHICDIMKPKRERV